MPEFKVTVTSGYKKIYYVEAEDWEEAEEMIFSPTGIHSERDPDFEEFESDKIETEEVEDRISEPKENKRIVLNDKLIASIGGKLIDRYYRAVVLIVGRSDEDEYAPNGNPDIIAIEQQYDSGKWGSTGGSWYVETLMGRCDHSNRDEPSDSICIDGGQQWNIESGMLDALNAYEQLKSEESK